MVALIVALIGRLKGTLNVFYSPHRPLKRNPKPILKDSCLCPGHSQVPRSDWDEAPPRRGAERQLLIRWVGFRGVGWGGVELAFKFGIQVLPRIYFQFHCVGAFTASCHWGFQVGP